MQGLDSPGGGSGRSGMAMWLLPLGIGLAAADGSGQVQDEPSVELADSQSVPEPPELPEPALAVPEPTLAD